MAAPRVGFAWNVTGDGKTALRASTGIFYNFPRSTGDGGYSFAGGCPVSCTDQIRWATFDDIASCGDGACNFVETPVNVTVGGYEQPLAKSYNVNVAFQRDIGFNTVAEIAWVGNFTWNHGRIVDVNRLPLYVYGNPANLVNNAPVNANSLRSVRQIPGHGLGQPVRAGPLQQDTAVQRDADQLQRRLTNGPADGLCLHAGQGRGLHRLRPVHRPDRRRGARSRPLLGADDRRPPHNMVANYSYDIPTCTETPVIKQLVSDWQVSGVTGC